MRQNFQVSKHSFVNPSPIHLVREIWSTSAVCKTKIIRRSYVLLHKLFFHVLLLDDNYYCLSQLVVGFTVSDRRWAKLAPDGRFFKCSQSFGI
jgi:hypothetical protein